MRHFEVPSEVFADRNLMEISPLAVHASHPLQGWSVAATGEVP